jgi:hypothetical protein
MDEENELAKYHFKRIKKQLIEVKYHIKVKNYEAALIKSNYAKQEILVLENFLNKLIN